MLFPCCSFSVELPPHRSRLIAEQESALIALIPANDSRLKPRRTWLYVCLGMGGCIAVSGLLFFFLLPRSVDVAPVVGPIPQTTITEHDKKTKIVMHFIVTAPSKYTHFIA